MRITIADIASMRALLAVCVAGPLCGRAVCAQEEAATLHVLVVAVRDSGRGAGLPGVTITIDNEPWTALTDSGGMALIRTPPFQSLVVRGRKLGYRPSAVTVTSNTGDTTRVTLELTRTPQELTGVTVVGERELANARLAGFEGRRRLHVSGSFITRADLEQWHSTRLTDALRRSPGVRIIDSSNVKLAASSRSMKPIMTPNRQDLVPCVMRVGVDGYLKEWGFAVDDLPVEAIHGIEIFPGPASIPAEFNGLRQDAACGLIMIWTR